eukprot:TRINITY_DN62488_c0_g1_i1.p1 TRINITY_DN62488_c0_g1~~TRINITY_DN62488_c0_g1_i1.p1  ORF type:complete len:244 (-),score=49.61 TRINITY_DN62488_c0_g1_i1:216-947(-)
MAACASGGHWEAAACVFDRCRETCEPTVVTYTSLLSACERRGSWLQTMQLLRQATRTAVRANALLCNTVISSGCWHGQWPRSVGTLALMAALPVQPTAVSLGAAVSACDWGEEWCRVALLLRSMQCSSLRRNAVACNAALGAFGRGSEPKWRLALCLTGSMSNMHIKRDLITCDVTIGALEASGHWAVGSLLVLQSLGEKMQSKGRLMQIGDSDDVAATSQSSVWDRMQMAEDVAEWSLRQWT